MEHSHLNKTGIEVRDLFLYSEVFFSQLEHLFKMVQIIKYN
jgi:hypothetical protein